MPKQLSSAAYSPASLVFTQLRLRTVHLADRILCITHVLILDEREARRLARDPDAPQRPVSLWQGRKMGKTLLKFQ
jgi:hypothetical protein